MKKLKKKQGRLDRLQLSAAILAQWQRLVASNKALNLFYWACARYCTGTPLQPSKWPVFYVRFFVGILFAIAPAAAGAIWSE
jgi:hypothetical protein